MGCFLNRCFQTCRCDSNMTHTIPFEFFEKNSFTQTNISQWRTNQKQCISKARHQYAINHSRKVQVWMAVPSKKHRDFISDPMGEKVVTELAGIGRAYEKKLTAKDIVKAYQVFGQFLFLKKQKEPFLEWLKKTADVALDDAESCFNCLNEWCEQHF